ncbi:unnamed protein product [Adineta ricciae]|uniref:G-protein coupled receptors family 1 profile domain-containing protein n=1 Tax=Adineta ricciae TaxID=249248 RepID=A0A815KQM0_ADIRI|nr:unnamed protein product [Adineta ricciae]
MSTAYIASLNSARNQIGLYFGIPVFIMSVIGEALSIIVLLSLKTFRQSSCGFYLLNMSIFNLIRLCLSSVFVIMSISFEIDYSISIFFFCRLRNFVVTTCNMGSITCLGMAVIDQYFATCFRPRWQQWANKNIAYRVTLITTLFWILNGILYIIFFNNISPTSRAACATSNYIFLQYHIYGYFIIYNNLLPLVTVIFGMMAFHNVRHLTHRTIPLVRRDLEKQLTVMVLVQTTIHVCTYLPFATITEMNLINAVVHIISVYSNGCSFYTYVCVSQRFRRQFYHVLSKMHLVLCGENRIFPNQIDA